MASSNSHPHRSAVPVLTGRGDHTEGTQHFSSRVTFGSPSQRALGAASPAPSPRSPPPPPSPFPAGQGYGVTAGMGSRERNPLRRRRLAGVPASLLLCCCYRRAATAAVSDSLRTTSGGVGAGTTLPAVYPLPRSRSTHGGSVGAARGLFPGERCSVLPPLNASVPQGR